MKPHGFFRRRNRAIARICCAALAVSTVGAVGSSPAAAATRRVAVISGDPIWCAFLQSNGYDCEVLPPSGPTGPLDAYDVVIHVGFWADPTGILADFLRSGKGVITGGDTPRILGIDTNPTVQQWIGANRYMEDDRHLVTVTTDPLLGALPSGTRLVSNGFAILPALEDTTGHQNAKVLARWSNGFGSIGLLRNHFDRGRSVYLVFGPETGRPDLQIIVLNAVRFAAGDLDIPAVSTWGLVALTLLLAAAASILLRRRRAAVG